MELTVYKNVDDEINKTHEEIGIEHQNNLYRILKVGELLTERKKDFKHGDWVKHIETAYPFDRRQASKYIKIYTCRNSLNGNCSSHLGVNAILKQLRDDEKAKKKKERIAQIEDVDSGEIITASGTFDVIVIDPPWDYGNKDKYDSEGFRGTVDYPTLTVEELTEMELPANDNCVLWLWTTHLFMRHSFSLLDEWGFEEKSILTWVKNKMGVGKWLRSSTEFCIMAVKGKPVINLTNQKTDLHSKVREHSRKPDEFYDMVNELCYGRKADYFGRYKHEGFEIIGNDIRE